MKELAVAWESGYPIHLLVSQLKENTLENILRFVKFLIYKEMWKCNGSFKYKKARLHVESGYKIGILKFFRFNFFLNKTLDKSKWFFGFCKFVFWAFDWTLSHSGWDHGLSLLPEKCKPAVVLTFYLFWEYWLSSDSRIWS